MELFTVQRYTAEADKVPSTVSGSGKENEAEILQRLLHKAEKRKKRKALAAQEHPAKKQDVAQTKQIADDADRQSATNQSTEATEISQPHVDHNDKLEALGETEQSVAKRQKVDMVLPPWLAHPTVISTSIGTTDADDAAVTITDAPYLTAHTRHVLTKMGMTRLFPVQAAVIPWLLEAHARPPPFRPRDICVSAPTGSGKTFAYALPLVQLLQAQRASGAPRAIRALVVLPVAELALQVFQVFKRLCAKTDLNVRLFAKQCAFATEQASIVECYRGKYYAKVDIVITTPGRLVDHLHATRGFCLKALRFLVIDEADRIMDAVFQNWLYHLDSHVRSTADQLLSGRAAPLCLSELHRNAITPQPHKLLFSATLSQDPEKLQSLRLFQPKLFTSVLVAAIDTESRPEQLPQLQEARGEFIGKYTTPAELTEQYCVTETRLKPLTLFSLVMEHGWRKFLCFTNSAAASERLAFVLERLCNKQLIVKEISGLLNAKDRASVLYQFSRGNINGLICSDALARGIDIPDVDIVISYDAPRHIKTHIHRIGRTARAGRSGTAVTLLAPQELKTFSQSLAEVGKTLQHELTVATTLEEDYAQQYTAALAALERKVQNDKRAKLVLKQRMKSQTLASIGKKPQEMSLMEKLQMQATEDALEHSVELTAAEQALQQQVGRRQRPRERRKPKEKAKAANKQQQEKK